MHLTDIMIESEGFTSGTSPQNDFKHALLGIDELYLSLVNPSGKNLELEMTVL
jgi:hypothetical protein